MPMSDRSIVGFPGLARRLGGSVHRTGVSDLYPEFGAVDHSGTKKDTPDS